MYAKLADANFRFAHSFHSIRSGTHIGAPGYVKVAVSCYETIQLDIFYLEKKKQFVPHAEIFCITISIMYVIGKSIRNYVTYTQRNRVLYNGGSFTIFCFNSTVLQKANFVI